MLEKVKLDQLPEDHPLRNLSADKFAKKPEQGKFAPKLEPEERCAVLALIQSGVDAGVVAVAFGIDRRTVGHIKNTASIHYKETRKELSRLGAVEFAKTYITPEVVERVAKAQKPDDPPVLTSKTVDGVPNPRSKAMAGIHVIKPEQCAHSHRIEIAYHDDLDGITGWMYRDLDSRYPDAWLHNGDESRLTSQNCKRMAEANITDD